MKNLKFIPVVALSRICEVTGILYDDAVSELDNFTWGDTDFTLLYIDKVVAHLGLEGNEGLEKLLDELQVEVRAMGKDIEEVTVDLSA